MDESLVSSWKLATPLINEGSRPINFQRQEQTILPSVAEGEIIKRNN